MKTQPFKLCIAPAMFIFGLAQLGTSQLPQIAPLTPAPVRPSCSVNPALQSEAVGDFSSHINLDRLVAIYNDQARSVRSLVAGVDMVANAGPSYGEEAKRSHEVGGLLIAQRPASLRLLAEAPFVNKRLFDLASDGKTFQMLIPLRRQFLIGRNASAGQSSKPLENVRPQHILDAMIWPELSDESKVRLKSESIGSSEEPYRLTVMRVKGEDWEADRTIFFDGETLRIEKIEIYGSDERPVSEIRYAEWARVPPEAGGNNDACFPRHIWINRPQEDYELEMLVTRIGLNQEIPLDRFHLQPQSGVQLIYLDAVPASQKP